MSDPTYSPVPQPPAHRSVKIPHLVFGLLFLGVAGIWALGASDMISGERLTILAPAVLIAAGLIGLIASLANGRNRLATETPDPGFYPDTNTTQTDDAVTDDDHTEEIR